MQPLRIINSLAPIRICDNGGWTDTWFAGYGRIFNMGVDPHIEVQLEVYPRSEDRERITIHAENFGERYVPRLSTGDWDRHPLIEAAIHRMGVPDEMSIEVNIHSAAPVGASTGTSAFPSAIVASAARASGSELDAVSDAHPTSPAMSSAVTTSRRIAISSIVHSPSARKVHGHASGDSALDE